VTPFVRIGGGRSAIKKKAEDNRSPRLLDGEEAGLLKATKDANPHLNDCIVAALETGMRKDEILSLQWKQVRWLQNELHLPGSKTKKPQQIPISPTLREVLTRRQTGTTKGPNPQTFTFGQDHYVFGNEAGGRVKNVKTAWETAVLRAHGVTPGRTCGKLSAENRAKLAEIDLNFHDLRHEAGSSKPDGRCTPSPCGSVTRSLKRRRSI
jgi:integrase